MENKEADGRQVVNLKLTQKELVSISELCTSPPKFIQRVEDSDDRIVLIRHGHPVAGLVPLWMLAVVEDFEHGRLVEPDGIFGPDSYK
jgi:antitoxin (DNA-binding transcriptional repressor) of toxin-antitoxin stability system